MIQLTHIPASDSAARSALVLIPGGPGLSSMTLRSLEILKRSFDLYFVDFPGTNGNAYDRDRTFDELCSALVFRLVSLSKPIVALGHSFGGFFAAEVALRMPTVKGCVCISTPFAKRALAEVGEHYKRALTSSLKVAEDRWLREQSDGTFAEWLSEYGTLYFSPESVERGQSLLKNDLVSARFFLANRHEAAQMESVLNRLAGWNGKKLSVLGAVDRLLSRAIAEEEARASNSKFVTISNGSHFVAFDQPQDVAYAIETEFRT